MSSALLQECIRIVLKYFNECDYNEKCENVNCKIKKKQEIKQNWIAGFFFSQKSELHTNDEMIRWGNVWPSLSRFNDMHFKDKNPP